MKILIIGGTGLISSSVTQLFQQANHDVTLFNRGKTASRIDDRVEVIRGDRRANRTAIENAIGDAGPWDCIIDMICGTAEDAESLCRAVRGGTGHLILCSSSNVYQKPASRYPVGEDER